MACIARSQMAPAMPRVSVKSPNRTMGIRPTSPVHFQAIAESAPSKRRRTPLRRSRARTPQTQVLRRRGCRGVSGIAYGRQRFRCLHGASSRASNLLARRLATRLSFLKVQCMYQETRTPEGLFQCRSFGRRVTVATSWRHRIDRENYWTLAGESRRGGTFPLPSPRKPTLLRFARSIGIGLKRVERDVDLHGREVPRAELSSHRWARPSGYHTSRQGP